MTSGDFTGGDFDGIWAVASLLHVPKPSSPKSCLERSDRGGTWGTWIDTELPFTDNLEGLFYPPVEVNGNTVAKAGRRVYVSRANGSPNSWITKNIPGSAVASALAIPSADLVYVGTESGDIFALTFSGTAWSAAAPLSRPRTGFVSDQQPTTAVGDLLVDGRWARLSV
jgi:hypothetical protein